MRERREVWKYVNENIMRAGSIVFPVIIFACNRNHASSQSLACELHREEIASNASRDNIDLAKQRASLRATWQ
jgi:hypothetical protein